MSKLDAKGKTLKKHGCLNPHPKLVKAPLFQSSLFFDPRDALQVKYEMLRGVSQDGMSKLEAAKLFGVSRPTFYEAESAFAESGLAGLLPGQRGPKGAHKLTTDIMDFIKKCLSDNHLLRSKEMSGLIFEHFGISVHPRSIERAMARKKKLRQK